MNTIRKFEMMTAFHKLDQLKSYLTHDSVEEMIVSESNQNGRRGIRGGIYGRAGYRIRSIPEVKIEIFANPIGEEFLMERLQYAATTGQIRNVVTSRCHCHMPEPKGGASGNSESDGNLKTATFEWNVKDTGDRQVRSVSVRTRDRLDLLSMIAGTLTLNHFDILSARKYKQKADALVILSVRPSQEDAAGEAAIRNGLEHARTDFRSVLSGKLNLNSKLRKKLSAVLESDPRNAENEPQTVIENDDLLPLSSIVKVTAYDFPGLLFCITHALFRCGLDVHLAKISTKAGQAKDIFYVRDTKGQKIESPAQILEIRTAIQKALSIVPDCSDSDRRGNPA